MAHRTSAGSNAISPLSGGKPFSGDGRIFDIHNRALVFADSFVRNRSRASYQEAREAWPISLVANLLRAFAGEKSELIAKKLLDQLGSLGHALSVSDEQILHACKENEHIGDLIIAARTLVKSALFEWHFKI